ncbi:MAG: glucosamine-6-phosphate isomerase [Clostridia bacterium]|nr:glucosamine-6-phosphate isomerase [Clostridia bacterium]MBQ8268207.1 glucosamine-6-phosphate isomerase [Clostridia bacterium]MBR2324557.1 glucosamine-6-phosphate isomerase [Clostridia bacterium]
MDFNSTVKGSLLEGFYPEGWDFVKIDECCAHKPSEVLDRQDFWNKDFSPVMCQSLDEFNVKMGHEIANEIKKANERGEKIAFILPVGPMGMYKWAVYFLKEWNVSCKNVWCFNMDEWADAEGNTITGEASFQSAMENAFYNPLGELTVPKDHRNFATKENLPTYPEKIAALKKDGAKLVLVYGIGRMCHIAFWEPQFGSEFTSDEEWLKQPYRIGAKLHPLTIEQNALTSFRSRTSMVPCRANTMGPGLMFQADYAIGGADGCFNRGMQWQGMSFWMTLRYKPTRFITSSFIPTIPGKLFFLEELAGPLCPDVN